VNRLKIQAYVYSSGGRTVYARIIREDIRKCFR